MTFEEQIQVKIIIHKIELQQTLIGTVALENLKSEVHDNILEDVKNDLKKLMKDQEYE